ncbi:MAG: ankyrin repeat domain-containing protein [Nocardioides sp.]
MPTGNTEDRMNRMNRMNRNTLPHLVAGTVAVLALMGCGAGAPESNDNAPVRPTPSAASTDPADVPEPRSKDMATPTIRNETEQAALDEQLREAAWDNDVDRATALVKRGADVNAKDETEQSAYLISTSEGYVDLLDLALAHGARVNDKDSWNGTGLIRAAERGHSLVVGRLLQESIDRDHVNRIGYQAIHEAVWLGEGTSDYVDTIRVLVAGGVELSRPSGTEGLTPLEMAGQRRYPALEAVLHSALDPTELTRPNAALLRAAERGDADEVARALRAGADIETRDALERTPLLLAVTEDRVDVARLLVAMGADPDALDHQHDTPWLVTGVTGSVPMVEALLPATPDLRILNRYGGTSLIPASERGHVDYVRRVLRTGIDVDHVNRLGWTALLEAVILGHGGKDHQEIVQLLLAAGADPLIADKDGVTALEHARARGHASLVRLLQDRWEIT